MGRGREITYLTEKVVALWSVILVRVSHLQAVPSKNSCTMRLLATVVRMTRVLTGNFSLLGCVQVSVVCTTNVALSCVNDLESFG